MAERDDRGALVWGLGKERLVRKARRDSEMGGWCQGGGGGVVMGGGRVRKRLASAERWLV